MSDILNDKDNVKVTGTADADYITNSGENVTIQSGKGNDTIEGSDLFGELFMFSYASGNNVITNFGVNDSIQNTSGTMSYAKAGDDMIVSIKKNSTTGKVTLQGAAEYNFKQSGAYLIIDAVNNISNDKDNIKLAGTGSNDSIVNNGENVTVDGKGGDDTLTGSDFGEVFLFSADGGSDIITNFGKNDTLKITSGSIASTAKSGNDYIINVKSAKYAGTITLKDVGDYKFNRDGNAFTVDAVNYIINSKNKKKVVGQGRDFITNSGSNVTIQSGRGNDTIEGSEYGELFLFSSSDQDNVILNFGKNDTIRCTSGKIQSIAAVGEDHVITIKGSRSAATVTLKNTADYNLKQSGTYIIFDSVNYISNDKDKKKITGTGKEDYIENTGEDVTIQAGAGNDTMVGSEFGETYLFSYASGADLITNFGVNDTLKSTSGNIGSLVTVGNDVVVTIKKSGQKSVGTITLQGAADYNFKQSKTALIVDDVNYMINDQDRKKFVGTDGRDYIINTGENVTIQAGAGADTIDGSTYGEIYLFSATDGDDVILNFDANDTLKITSGSITNLIRVGDDYVVDVRNANYISTVTLQGAGEYEFKQSGQTLMIDRINYMINRTDNKKVVGTDGRDYIINSGQDVTIQAGKGNDTIEGSHFGEVFLFSSEDGNNVITNFGENDVIQCVSCSISAVTTVDNDTVVKFQNKKKTSEVRLLNTNGYDFKGDGSYLMLDPINYITVPIENKKVVGTSGNDYIVNPGFENVTIEGKGGNDTIEGSDYGEVFNFGATDGENVILNFGMRDTLHCTSGSISSYIADGDDVLVTLKSNERTSIVTLQGAAQYSDLIRKSGSYLIADSITRITNRQDNKKVVGTNGSDYIVNAGDNVTIDGKGGNDSIIASNNAEVFLFGALGGEDYISGFGKDDTLQITSGEIYSTLRAGDDFIVNVKNGLYVGSITLESAGDYEFKQTGRKLTVDYVHYIVNSDDDTKVWGTSGRDYIVNGGANVTIEAGEGNDTIEGSNFGERFQFSYASGDDVITNFGLGDTLQVTSAKTISTVQSGSDLIVTMTANGTTGTVTLQDVADKYTFVKSGKNFIVRSKPSLTSAQQPSDEYWFLNEDSTVERSELNEIVSSETAIDLPDDFINDALNRKTPDLVNVTRHRLKK